MTPRRPPPPPAQPPSAPPPPCGVAAFAACPAAAAFPPPPTSALVGREVRAANAAGLVALSVWAYRHGPEAAGTAFGMPAALAALLANGGPLAEALAGAGDPLWFPSDDLLAHPPAPAAAAAPPPAAAVPPETVALWAAQEATLLALTALGDAGPGVAARAFRLGPAGALAAAALRRRAATGAALAALARTARPALRLRPDLLAEPHPARSEARLAALGDRAARRTPCGVGGSGGGGGRAGSDPLGGAAAGLAAPAPLALRMAVLEGLRGALAAAGAPPERPSRRRRGHLTPGRATAAAAVACPGARPRDGGGGGAAAAVAELVAAGPAR